MSNEDNSPSNTEGKKETSDGPSRKSFLGRIGHFLQGELKDRQALLEIIHSAEENAIIDADTREMLEGVIEISEQRVRDIMLPRSQMVTIEKGDDLEKLIPLITDAQHSRYPVISNDKDHVEGILLAKDLLQYLGSNSSEFDIEKVIRPAVVVAENKRIDRLLKEFREERYHMAIVVDEFGGVSGLVTIEDILEEIVGDIEDEFDDEETVDIRQTGPNLYAVKALATIEKFNETFDTDFSDEEVDTVGGLVMTHLGDLPVKGEVVEIGEYTFRVTAADSRRVIQFQVATPDKTQQSTIKE